jgi:hypothetical protein
MEPIPLGRQAWSLVHQARTMALGPGTRQAADEEARAELDLLNSRLEKTTQLNKKLQTSLSRLEGSGRSLQDAVGPIYGNTQKLQVLGTSMCDQSRPSVELPNSLQTLIKCLQPLRESKGPPIRSTMRRTSSGKGQYPRQIDARVEADDYKGLRRQAWWPSRIPSSV